MGEGSSIAGRREALREAVLAAAEARVVACGLAELGVREIAREAGCSSGMLYKLFASHDELVLAVNARTLAALGEAVAAGLRAAREPGGAPYGVGSGGAPCDGGPGEAPCDGGAGAVPGAVEAGAALCAMADAYLDYAMANTPRWDALFAHRMAGGAGVPDWYARLRDRLFEQLAGMIGAATPAAAPGDFARTLFSAVHGVVALGLQQKVGEVAPDTLRAELRGLVRVIARGLTR